MRFHSYKLKMKHKTGSLIFAHWLIMGRSRKWPDLRSPISKIQDIYFASTDDLIIFRKFHNFPLTRALLGLWISHRLLGGGAFERPPPWSRLLVGVEKNERQRSKAREKSFRNHFGHFLAQVKIGVSRGQNSKIFQNGFSTIKSLILKIEQRIWYHRVCLVKARRTIYKMTLKGQGQSLTSGQVRPRSRDDRNGSYCISVDSPGHDERTDTNPTSLSLFDQKLLANDCWWPRVTSNDLWRGR